MSASRPYVEENAIERERLRTLAARMSDDDLSQPLGDGWTPATVLAHLAFWDQRQLVLLKKWEREGVKPSPVDVDTINEAVRTLCLALPPRAAAQLAMAAAEAVDHELEQIPPDLVAAIEAAGLVRALRRALHRREHLDPIEAALAFPPVVP